MPAQLENGYLKIANEIVEAMCRLKTSNYESRFLWCLFRKTYGYGKKQDFISLSQFAKLSGIEIKHIARTKTRLIKRNIITVTNGKVGFQKDMSRWAVPIQGVPNEGVPKQVTGTPQIGYQVLPKQGDTKETNTKDNIQKKERYTPIDELDDSHFDVIAQKYNVPLSFVRSKYDDMVNWHESTGKQKKDWVATLRGFVKEDAVKVRKDHDARSKIEFINP
jgi:phage replication O-like protein O